MSLINEDKNLVINLIMRDYDKEYIAEILKMKIEDINKLKPSQVIDIIKEKYDTFTELEFERIEKEVKEYWKKQADDYKGRDWVGIIFKDKI